MANEYDDLGFEPIDDDYSDLGFEPEQKLIEEDAPLPEPSQSDAALLGAQQGATFGLSDELGGGIQSGLDRAQRLMNEYTGLVGKSPTQVSEEMAQQGYIGDIGPTSSGELYQEAVGEERSKLSAAEKAHPYTMMGADLATGVTTGGLAAKGASSIASKVPGLLDKFKTLSKAKQAATVGGLTGGVEAAGRTEEDLGSAEGLIDVGSGVATGGILGGMIGKFGEKLETKNLQNKSEMLLEEADEAASRSIGAKPKDISKELEARYKYGAPKEQGIQALEEGIVDPLSRPKETYKKALNARKDIQSGYDAAIDKFDNRINLSEKQAGDLSKTYFNRIKSKVADTVRGNDQIPNEMKNNLINETAELQDEILSALDSTNPIKNLQDLYVRYNDVMFKNIKSPTSDARKVMRNEIKAIQRELADVVDPGTKDAFKNLDNRYTNILDIENWTNIEAGLEKKIGVGDIIQGATARMAGIPVLGEAITGASVASKKLIGKDLSDVLGGAGAIQKHNKAKKLQKIIQDPGKIRKTLRDSSDVVAGSVVAGGSAIIDSNKKQQAPYKSHQKATKQMETASPEEIQQEAQNIREKYGEQAEQLALKIENMVDKDKAGRQREMFALLQNPQYKKILEKNGE